MTRHTLREHAFIVIFEGLFGNSEPEETLEDAIEALEWKDDEYVRTTVLGVHEKKEELDNMIIPYLKKGWTIARLSRVTYALLKLAIYEIKYVDDVPEGVAVNEAVELCKEYATETDASLLNGILGNVIKGLK